MCLNVDRKFFVIGIVPIKGDGNCLFASLAFQLKRVKIDSDEHDNETKELRQKVVDHIRTNFDRFKMAIKGTLYERVEREGKPLTDIDQSCEHFIQNELPSPCCWGGSETIMAVREIFEVNVIVVPEKRQPYFANGFNFKYRRSIFLAYRCYGNAVYEHYDSVCRFEHDLLFRFANSLSKNISE